MAPERAPLAGRDPEVSEAAAEEEGPVAKGVLSLIVVLAVEVLKFKKMGRGSIEKFARQKFV